MTVSRVAYRPPRMTPAQRRVASERFLAIMRGRRSIRDFSTRPVPRELVVNAIEAAALAPSGANQQPWTFVLIGDDPDLRARIRAAAEAEEREGYEHRMSPGWLAALVPLGTDWHKPHLTDAPWLIVVFEQAFGLRTEGGVERKVKHFYVRESVGIAVGVLLASLTHAGLATLTHTPSPMGFLTKILRRPHSERPYVVIPVGYAAPNATVPGIQKKPLGDVLVRSQQEGREQPVLQRVA